MGKELVYDHTLDSGDFVKVSLVNPPLNEVDDILVEIKSKNIDGVHILAVQDWEAIMLCKGLVKALEKKYGNIEDCIMLLEKQNRLVLKRKVDLNANRTKGRR